jgi:hypothetical protein
VQLQNVSRTGFLNNSDSLIIEGTWFPQHFSLAVTDGVGAWKAEVSEDLATRFAGDLQISTTQFIDKAQLHLGQQKANSLYSLHYVSSDEVQLLCNPTEDDLEDDLDLRMKFAIDLVLVTASVVEITFDMVKFLLDAYSGLKEDFQRQARASVREQAVIENSMTSLKSELQMMKTSGFKTCEETLALVSVPSPASGGKRRKFDSSEDVSGKRSSQQQQAASNSKLRRSTSGTGDFARLGLAPVPLAVGIEGNGASRVSVSAEEQEIIGEGSNEDRSNEKVLAKFNIDGSLEHLVPTEKKKRGRPRKSLVPAEATTNKSQLLPIELSGGNSLSMS